jgi:hypothetical protein
MQYIRRDNDYEAHPVGMLYRMSRNGWQFVPHDIRDEAAPVRDRIRDAAVDAQIYAQTAAQ